MIKGKTQSGFSFKLDNNKLDDMELLEFLAGVDDDMTLLPELVERLLGKEQKAKLYDFIRKSEGHVSISKCYAIVMEIFEEAGKQNDDTKKD